jgi:hypothetical protein
VPASSTDNLLSEASSRAVAPARIGWLQTFDLRYLRMPSVVALVIANLIPLYGVIFWGWDLFGLMALYWMETGIIGLFAMVQMVFAARWFSLFLVPFFTLHFGGFMAGHMLFLAIMFGGMRDISPGQIPAVLENLLFGRGYWVAFLALFVSHGVSFVLNVWRYLRPGTPDAKPGPGEVVTAKNPPQGVMIGAYGRVIVMHVTILLGALLVEVFGTQVAAFALLIAIKIAVDVAAHIRKNFRPVEEAA